MAAGDIVKWVGGDAGGTTDPTIAANWSTAAVPADQEIIVFPATAAYACAGGDLTGGGVKAFQGFIIEEGYAYQIGSLAAYLQIDMLDGVLYYDVEIAATTSQVFLDVDNYHRIVVTRSTPQSTGQYGVNLIGLHDADDTAGRGTIYVACANGASTVGIGANTGELMEANKIVVTGGTCTVGDLVVEFGGAVAPDVEVTNGTLRCYCPVGAYDVLGDLVYHEDGVVGTLNADGGIVYYKSDGTATTVNIQGKVDCTLDLRGRTWTNCNIYRGGSLIDPYKTLTLTNDIDLEGCGIEDIAIDLGTHLTLSRAAI